MTNEDTLFISAPGKYECKVINPNSNCPLDTTSYFVILIVQFLMLKKEIRNYRGSYFQSASEIVTIELTKPVKDEVEIYNSTGILINSIFITEKNIEN